MRKTLFIQFGLALALAFAAQAQSGKSADDKGQHTTPDIRQEDRQAPEPGDVRQEDRQADKQAEPGDDRGVDQNKPGDVRQEDRRIDRREAEMRHGHGADDVIQGMRGKVAIEVENEVEIEQGLRKQKVEVEVEIHGAQDGTTLLVWSGDKMIGTMTLKRGRAKLEVALQEGKTAPAGVFPVADLSQIKVTDGDRRPIMDAVLK